MENNKSCLLKINSKYVFNKIFDYCYDFALKFRLFKYSKIFQQKFEISKKEFLKMSFLIKIKTFTPENILRNRNKLLQIVSPNENDMVKDLLKDIIIYSYNIKLNKSMENNIYDYYVINNEEMINLMIENSIFINNTNLEIELSEELINKKEFINYIQNIFNFNLNIFLTFISKNENTDNYIKKFSDLKFFNFTKIGLDFNYIKNITPDNILEFSYEGNLSNNDFEIINNFHNLTKIKLKNNVNSFKFLINFKDLIYLSVLNCPSAEIIIESEKISKNLKYFEFDDESIIQFKFNDQPTKNKINFSNLEYLYFDYDIIDFNKSTKIKKLKDNKIELINSKMEFFLNLLLNCRSISEIDLSVYQINKINKDRLELFFQVFKSLSLKSLIISSLFENDIVFNLIQSENIAKSCQYIKLCITDLEIIDYIIKNYINLEVLEINIEEKIAKFRINTPNEKTLKLLNDNLHKKYETFKPENNWVNIIENQKNKIKKLILNNSNFKIMKQNIFCYSFGTLIELRLKNIPIRVNTLPLFQSNSNINFPSLEILIIRITNYIDSFYQLEFKRKTLLNNLGSLENPFNLNMNLVENQAIENFCENINKIPKVQNLVLNFMLPGLKKDIIKNMLGKIFELKFLINLDFCINSKSEQKVLKNNQIMKLFPKLKQNKISLPSKLNISIDI